jgi:hypothetical protein
LLLVYPEALVFLRGWRLELMIGPLITGRIARVHAEKHLGTLILDEAWVSEIHVVPLDSIPSARQPAAITRQTLMSTEKFKPLEARRQALLGQLAHRRGRRARRPARTRFRRCTARAHHGTGAGAHLTKPTSPSTKANPSEPSNSLWMT